MPRTDRRRRYRAKHRTKIPEEVLPFKPLRAESFYERFFIAPHRNVIKYLDAISKGKFKGVLIEIGPFEGKHFIQHFYKVKEVNIGGLDHHDLRGMASAFPQESWAKSRIVVGEIENAYLEWPNLQNRADGTVAISVFSSPTSSNSLNMLKGMNFILKQGGLALIAEIGDDVAHLPTNGMITKAGFRLARIYAPSQYERILHLVKEREAHIKGARVR